MLPLKDKELKVLEIVRKLGEASAKDVWKNLKEENIPYTTVSSILKKLNKLGIVEKRAVRSRGRRGVKYIYRI
ncbi:BlaI/MecI/CopY family transcriptional regulator, partial [Ferroglobus sp.]|uniref:BlaI/MecI/CopY family transcriptional regulator n=1 Tax=Ferroglobus sp. TaxID=2614230 RepID=UPI0025C50E05